MKQTLQSLKSGKTTLADVPCPQLKPGHILIRTQMSLISKGTEKMLLDFGKASLIKKARQQPDKVRKVIDKIKTDGLFSTIEAVRHQLNQLIPMGYCNVGTIISKAADVNKFAIGDRVVSNGPHAEIVMVAKNLCCKVPDAVPDEEAVFTILGAIALQGLRLAQPALGESFAVIGLGLIGLLTVQLLLAHGCKVLALDVDHQKLKIATQLGAETILITKDHDDLLRQIQQFSLQRGMDGVLITASTPSSEPIHLAAQMCRKRGRIVLVGVTGLILSRTDFYEKELSFQVSCSYGPGRYDSTYEIEGHDYPFGFVRFTAQRNFEAFLAMLLQKKITTSLLGSHQFSILEIKQAYDLVCQSPNSLGVIIHYPNIKNNEQDVIQTPVIFLASAKKTTHSDVSIGVIGAGNYASRILLPAFRKCHVHLHTLACISGVSGTLIGKKFGFNAATTSTEQIFSNPDINTIVIASRHDTHAKFISQAITAKKHIFVEKPICLTLAELEMLTKQLNSHQQLIWIGFNRRFALHTQKIKQLLRLEKAPASFVMTVNAGAIPLTHWAQQKIVGGGRIIGEACHFIDLLRYLVDAPITNYTISQLKETKNAGDNVTMTFNFAEGSVGTIHYFANGHTALSKERLEIFTRGKILQLDNFRVLRGYGWSQFKKMKLWRQDKGHAECVAQFIKAIRGINTSSIPLDEILEVSKVAIEIANQL